MNAVIFGANGQLGRDLVRRFGALGEVRGYGRTEADVADNDSVRRAIGLSLPDVIINAAAYTDVERAEDEESAAYRVNAEGARVVAQEAAAIDAAVIHISTDFVFDGRASTPYGPGDPISPLSVYGRTKAEGEALAAAANPRHFIVRTAWLYGPGGNNFVEKIIAAAQSRPELAIVDDQIGSPTHTYDVAEAVAALCATEAYGIHHAVNRGICSRFDFARTFLAMAGIETPVRPNKTGDFATKAERPLYSALDPRRLEAAAGIVMRPWEDALRHYMERRNSP